MRHTLFKRMVDWLELLTAVLIGAMLPSSDSMALSQTVQHMRMRLLHIDHPTHSYMANIHELPSICKVKERFILTSRSGCFSTGGDS